MDKQAAFALPGKELQSSFDGIVQGFCASLHELRTIATLRVDDSAITIFEQDLNALQDNVRALEDKLRGIKETVSRERQAISKAERVLEDCSDQTLRLKFIGQHLPQRLPAPPLPEVEPHAAPRSVTGVEAQAVESQAIQGADVPEPSGQVAAEKRKKRPAQAPRRYVAETEYAALSTYMTQRLPLSKVNVAVDEAADLADANMKTLAHARAGVKMATQEWKRAQSLLVNIASKDAVKGKSWFTDADLRRAATLKPDKTGKAIMTILRHLGRIQEARLPLDGKLESIYSVS